MPMNYEEAIEYLKETNRYGMVLGLERITNLLHYVGNPHKKLKFVHVAGTNGKGSTVAFLSSILKASSLRVGVYSSPALIDYTEIIKVNNEAISKTDLAQLTSVLKAACDQMVKDGLDHPTEFEITTAMSFLYFLSQDCDICILEVGLGGLLDSTNVIESCELAILTSISFDHVRVLGNTLTEIALHKCGIIKEGIDVLSCDQEDEVMEVIESSARNKKARLHNSELPVGMKADSLSLNGQTFTMNGIGTLKINLAGDYQIYNAALAVTAAHILKNKGYKSITAETIRQGLIECKWPCRFECINKEPVIIVDGGHNAKGIDVLVSSLYKHFKDKKLIFIMGVMADKDYHYMIKKVSKLAKEVICVTAPNKRALKAEDLSKYISENYGIKTRVANSLREAANLSLETATKKDVIVAFGSLYYVGLIKEEFLSLLNAAPLRS